MRRANLLGAAVARRYRRCPSASPTTARCSWRWPTPPTSWRSTTSRMMTGSTSAPRRRRARTSSADRRLAPARATSRSKTAPTTRRTSRGRATLRESAATTRRSSSSCTPSIAQAVEQGASDIHFEPEEGEIQVRSASTACSRRDAVPRSMVGGDRLAHQDHGRPRHRRAPRCRRTAASAHHRRAHDRHARRRCCRSSTARRVVLRILDQRRRRRSASPTLGMLDADRASASSTRSSSAHGAVLVTGPTGSGKTTTLYARAARRSTRRETHDHHDRGPGRVPARRASSRCRSTRRRA